MPRTEEDSKKLAEEPLGPGLLRQFKVSQILTDEWVIIINISLTTIIIYS